MQSYVKLVYLDDNLEESRFIKKGNTIIEAFDYMGKLWPLSVGEEYKVNLELQQLDFHEIEILSNKVNKIIQINGSYEHHLYGFVKNNIFRVESFNFDFEKYNDYYQYNNKYIKFIADRINVEFLEKVR